MKTFIDTQTALFFRSKFEGSFEELSLEIKKKIGDGNTQYLPVPENAPDPIPRIIIKYPTFFIQIYTHRVDLFCKKPPLDIQITLDVAEILTDLLKIEIGRVGHVSRFFIEKNQNSLSGLFKDQIFFAGVKEINIRINQEILLGSYKCNNIEKIDPGQFTNTKGETAGGLIVLRDINTLAENLKDYSFNKHVLSEFMTKVISESSNLTLIKES